MFSTNHLRSAFLPRVAFRRRTLEKRYLHTEEKLRSYVYGSAKEILHARATTQKTEAGIFKILADSASSIKSEAAVIIPICIVADKVCLLYTTRSSKLNSHRSEVSFPGGYRDAEDASIKETALREIHEELGINSSKIETWAQLARIPNRVRTVAISPFVCDIGEVDTSTLNINHEEVAEAFAVPLSELLSVENQGYTTFKNGQRYPVFRGIKQTIWGLSAIITDNVLSLMFPDVYKSKMSFVKKVRIR